METRHIRKSNANVTDHRFRGIALYSNKATPTLCGAEPTSKDYSKKGGIHIIAQFSILKPDWIAEICVDCRAKVAVK